MVDPLDEASQMTNSSTCCVPMIKVSLAVALIVAVFLAWCFSQWGHSSGTTVAEPFLEPFPELSSPNYRATFPSPGALKKIAKLGFSLASPGVLTPNVTELSHLVQHCCGAKDKHAPWWTLLMDRAQMTHSSRFLTARKEVANHTTVLEFSGGKAFFLGPSFLANEDGPVVHYHADSGETTSSCSSSRDRCFEAFTVVLSQSLPKGGIRGTPYISSTLNLQLACLGLCRVCRSLSSLHVNLWEDSPENWWKGAHGKGTPESLWVAPDDDEDKNETDAITAGQTPEGERASSVKASTRVPLVLPFSVTCRLSSHALHSKRTTKLWARLERLRLELTLSASSGWCSSPVELPQRLKQLTIIDREEEGAGFIPAALLSSLSSGGSPSLLKLHIDGNFDLADVVWPACLIQLSFGPRYYRWFGDESFAKIRWPASLECLVFFDRGFSGFLQDAVWPSSLRKIVLGNDFVHPIAGVVWPPFLQQLSFGLRFNRYIAEVGWPTSLQKLSFGINSAQPNADDSHWGGLRHKLSTRWSFNKPISGGVLPPCVRQLSLGNSFNQPIIGVEWPASLQELSFGFNFNQPVVGVVWPASLQELSFGRRFNQPVIGIVWPNSLQSLKFGLDSDFDHPISGVVWPTSLKTLTLPRFYRH